MVSGCYGGYEGKLSSLWVLWDGSRQKNRAPPVDFGPLWLYRRAFLPRTFLGGPPAVFYQKKIYTPSLGRYVHVSPRCKPHTEQTPHTRGTSAKNSRLLSPEIPSILLL